MAEYTYADVIIDPNDPRVEIGKEYYFGDSPAEVLRHARKDKMQKRLQRVEKDWDDPFIENLGYRSICIIRKKEPEKKYVPFDLSKEEDKAKLRGAWVRVKEVPNIEKQINGLNAACVFLYGMENQGLKPKELVELWEFIDGTPCGKLVEEDE